MLASCSSTLRCSLRNSLSNIVLIRLIADAVRLSIFTANDQVRIHLFHFLGNEPKLRDTLADQSPSCNGT